MMKFINIIFILLATLSVNIKVYGAVPTRLTGVNIKIIAMDFFSPRIMFSPHEKYFLDSFAKHFHFKLDGQTYSISLEPFFNEVLKFEWGPAIGTNFEETDNQSEANLRVTAVSGSAVPGVTPDTYAFHTVRGGVSNIVFIRNQFADLGNLWKRYKSIMHNPSKEYFVRFVLKLIAKHEVGHAMGFDHPSAVIGATTYTEPGAFQNPGVPIMDDNMIDYILRLHEHVGHNLMADDIVIAPQEEQAARALSTCVIPPYKSLCREPNFSSIIPQLYSILGVQ